MQPKPFAAVPLRSIPPMSEPSNNTNFGPKPAKAKKKKPAGKSTDQFVPRVWDTQPKKKTSASKKTKRQFEPGSKVERKNPQEFFNEADLDFSLVPAPYCSCTGNARVCYRCGGGWQSTCCTNNVSQYPLPMSCMRPGARLARVCGRKMSGGAYRNLLCKLASEGHDLSHPVDLKNHWARHGTNMFVTIK